MTFASSPLITWAAVFAVILGPLLISGPFTTVHSGVVPVGSEVFPGEHCWSDASDISLPLALADVCSTANPAPNSQPKFVHSPSATNYSVTFTETGLPSGTEWFVNLTGGASYSSTTNSISFTEPNGTYPYTVATVDKTYYSALLGQGPVWFVVNGASVSTSVGFLFTPYVLVFEETGLPSGTNWSVTVDGVTYADAVDQILLPPEPNGSYGFTVGSVSGYTVNRSSGTATVDGANVAEWLKFTSTFLGLPAVEGYALVGGIVAAVIAVAASTALLAQRRIRKATAAPRSTGNPPPPLQGSS